MSTVFGHHGAVRARKLFDFGSGVLDGLVIRGTTAIAAVPFEGRGIPEEADVTQSKIVHTLGLLIEPLRGRAAVKKGHNS
jgi:hypothetical protein